MFLSHLHLKQVLRCFWIGGSVHLFTQAELCAANHETCELGVFTQHASNIEAQSTQDARAQVLTQPFDVACVQCEHPHSHTQVPFALRRVARPVWMRLKGFCLKICLWVLCEWGLRSHYC